MPTASTDRAQIAALNSRVHALENEVAALRNVIGAASKLLASVPDGGVSAPVGRKRGTAGALLARESTKSAHLSAAVSSATSRNATSDGEGPEGDMDDDQAVQLAFDTAPNKRSTRMAIPAAAAPALPSSDRGGAAATTTIDGAVATLRHEADRLGVALPASELAAVIASREEGGEKLKDAFRIALHAFVAAVEDARGVDAPRTVEGDLRSSKTLLTWISGIADEDDDAVLEDDAQEPAGDEEEDEEEGGEDDEEDEDGDDDDEYSAEDGAAGETARAGSRRPRPAAVARKAPRKRDAAASRRRKLRRTPAPPNRLGSFASEGAVKSAIRASAGRIDA